MQQLLLRATLSLVLASSALQAQSGSGMKAKGDSTQSAMNISGMQQQIDRTMGRGSNARHMATSSAMEDVHQQLGGMLVGVVGHRTNGMVWVSSSGSMRTISLDSSFAIVGGQGSGLYLSASEQFGMSATRVGALSKEMGAQSYQIRLRQGAAPRHLLIVNESSHAVLARASLGGAMRK